MGWRSPAIAYLYTDLIFFSLASRRWLFLGGVLISIEVS